MYVSISLNNDNSEKSTHPPYHKYLAIMEFKDDKCSVLSGIWGRDPGER